MKLTGHSSEAVHRGYTHRDLEVLRNVVQKLPLLTRAKPPGEDANTER